MIVGIVVSCILFWKSDSAGAISIARVIYSGSIDIFDDSIDIFDDLIIINLCRTILIKERLEKIVKVFVAPKTSWVIDLCLNIILLNEKGSEKSNCFKHIY